MTTTTATTTTARVMTCADNERVHDLRRAMYSWRADPVGGRTRLVKDIAREHGATNHEITRVYPRVSAGLRPNALDLQDLDAYAAALREALDHCLHVVLDRRSDEARCLRLMKGAKTHHKARTHRAWRRNAERMARNWALAL